MGADQPGVVLRSGGIVDEADDVVWARSGAERRETGILFHVGFW